VKEIEDFRKRGFWKSIFLRNIKFSSFKRTKKLYWRRNL